MRHSNESRRFQEYGPVIDSERVLTKRGSCFAISSHNLPWVSESLIGKLQKIAAALNRGDFADAAIRFSHVENELLLVQAQGKLFRANFNPAEPRDSHGRWSKEGEDSRIVEDDYPSASYCRLVKELCIVEATDALPTRDYGFAFHKVYNSCMDRHGCLGRA